MRRLWRFTGLAVGMAAAAFCAAGAPAVVSFTPDAALYAAHCGICHGEMGTGTIMLGRRLGRDHAILAQRTDLDGDYVRHIVRNGLGSMPPQTRVDLSDAELARVVAFLTRPAAIRLPSAGRKP